MIDPMSKITFPEKTRFEKLCEMKGGYVLDFNNSTFQEFVADNVGKDIFHERYNKASGSKANRLRAFWIEEPNHRVGKLLSELLDYYVAGCMSDGQEDLLRECRRIASSVRFLVVLERELSQTSSRSKTAVAADDDIPF
jgi:hypothetical protein